MVGFLALFLFEGGEWLLLLLILGGEEWSMPFAIFFSEVLRVARVEERSEGEVGGGLSFVDPAAGVWFLAFRRRDFRGEGEVEEEEDDDDDDDEGEARDRRTRPVFVE